MDHVWVVTRWDWGAGGDDQTIVVGVFSTSEKAYAAAEKGDEVAAFPLDESVAPSASEQASEVADA